MDIELLFNWKSSLFIKDYIKESIDLFGEELNAAVSSPARKGLQNIDKNSTRLEKYAETLYSIVAKLIWVEKVEGPTLRHIYCFFIHKSD